MPHTLTPAAPPSMRKKLMTLAPCGMSDWGRLRIAPRLSDGKMNPSPTRPSTVQATSMGTAQGVPGPPSVSMSANDNASNANPMDTNL